jgi:hypothetical protein
LRKKEIEHRSQFFRGLIFGIAVVIVKFVVFLPIDVADCLYGAALLVTMIITLGEPTGVKYFVVEARILDFVIGFLFPLDLYAVLILFGIPLTD